MSIVRQRGDVRILSHEGIYNWVLNTKTGAFVRWGKTMEDNPLWSPIGPELLDVEISTICHGLGAPCAWCYKSNTPSGINMSLSKFSKIFQLVSSSKNLTQIAFGIGDIEANPDLFEIFSLCKKNGVVPNVTINGARMTPGYYCALASLCGSIAVSHYGDDDICFGAIKELADRGHKQINIHKLLAQDTLPECFDLIKRVKKDERSKFVNNIVFLLLKPKGARNRLTPITDYRVYEALIQTAKEAGVGIGMDSCGAPSVLKSCEHLSNINKDSIEPCESTLFSLYINAEGQAFPCSFTEGSSGWEQGIDVVEECKSLQDLWEHPRLEAWRQTLLASTKTCDCTLKKDCRACPVYDITPCKKECTRAQMATT